MGLRRKDDVMHEIRRHKRRRLPRADGNDSLDGETSNTARVVVKSYDAVAGAGFQRVPDQSHEVMGDLLPIDNQPAVEEPMARVLTVRLCDVKALHVAGIAPNLVDKEIRVVIQVPVIKCESHLPIHTLQRSPSLLYERYLEGRLGHHAALEAGERFRVRALRHPVVHLLQKSSLLFLSERCRRLDRVTPGSFDTPDLVETTRMTDGNGAGGPGGREVHSRPDLEHDTVPSEESRASELRRLECLTQQPSENREFLRCQLTGGVDVEAKLSLDILDIRGHTLPRRMEQCLSTSGRQTGRTVEM